MGEVADWPGVQLFHESMSVGTAAAMVVADSASFDADRRDPYNLNDHLQVQWSDIIGEPDAIRSNECIWHCSHRCYRSTKNCCYQFLTVLFAPFFAFCMGCQFACLAFQHIWCFVPGLRCLKMNCVVLRDCFNIILQSCCAPWMEACGQCLSRVKIRYQKLSDDPDEDPLLSV